MTTPTNSSPFSSEAKNDSMPSVPTSAHAPNQNDFSIRTMQDDLAKIQNIGSIEEKPAAPMENKTVPAPTPRPINPTEVYSEKISPFPQIKVEEKIAQPAPKTTVNVSNNSGKKSSRSIKVVLSIIFVLIIIIAGLSAYYFFLMKKPVQEAAVLTQPAAIVEIETPVQQPITIPAEPPVVIEAPAPKYSADKPNFFPVDVVSMGDAEIKDIFIKLSKELETLNILAPYEFVAVDNNNNPIAFQIFANSVKFNLSPELLKSLSNDFSFYFYNDNSNIRMAINAGVSNKDTLMKELIKQEKTFLSDASFLFLGTIPEIKNGVFATSSHGQHIIRFLNANAAKNLSIDYTVASDRLIIATSKNTVRAVLDKIEKEIPTKQVGLDDSTSTSQATIDTKTATNVEKNIAPANLTTSNTTTTKTTISDIK